MPNGNGDDWDRERRDYEPPPGWRGRERDPGWRWENPPAGSWESWWNQYQQRRSRFGDKFGDRYSKIPGDLTRWFGDPGDLSFHPAVGFGSASQFRDLWQSWKQLTGKGLGPIHFAYAAGQAYEQDPARQKIGDYIMSGEMSDVLESRGREALSRGYGEARRRGQESLARAGMERSGLGMTAQTMLDYSRARDVADVVRAAELAEIDAQQGWALQQARDISNLWQQMANTLLAQQGKSGGAQGFPWAEAAGGVLGEGLGGLLGNWGEIFGGGGAEVPSPEQEG